MKSIKLLVLSLCGLFSMSSCVNDFLDRDPMDIISEDLVWSNENAVNAYMAGMYEDMFVEPHAWLINWGTLGHYTDESMRSYSWGYPYTPVLDLSSLQQWEYNKIRIANVFLQNIQTSTLNEDLKQRWTAEAHFVRAFHYFTMAKRYGGVPLIKEVQEYTGNNVEELKVPRNTEEEVWNFIAEECDLAIAGLPESYGSTDQFRVTKYAAAALKARALLYAGSISRNGTVQLNGLVGIPADKANDFFKRSMEASDMIIKSGKFALFNQDPDPAANYQQLFLDKTMNSEAIFVKAFASPDKAHNFDYAMAAPSFKIDWGTNTSPTLELVESYEYIDGTPGTLKTTDASGNLIYYENAEDIFKDKDPRFFASILYPGSPWQNGELEVRRGIIKNDGSKEAASAFTDVFSEDPSMKTGGKDGLVMAGDCSRTGFYIKKFMDPTNRVEMDRSETNFMVFRYAETLLNYAEAAFELGLKDQALQKVNEVRKRAGIKEKNSLTMDDIRNERRVELAFENLRYWDLVRWRVASKVMNNTTFSALIPWLDYKTKKYVFEKSVNTLNLPKTFLDKQYYLEIPGVAQNDLLEQNPGY